MKAKIFIGCSGFHYKHWKGIFYPEDLPQKKWFEFYGQHFNTLELNVTFYHFPEASVLKSWYDRSATDFKFSVKAPRVITHFKKFNAVDSLVREFYQNIEKGLNRKLGAVLFQLPPNYSYTADHLDRILKCMNPDFNNVIEFRHVSWWNQEVYDAFRTEQLSFCGMSHPAFPNFLISTAPHFYYRMHGAENLYASDYSSDELDRFADKLKNEQGVRTEYIYFNNDINGFAISNAKYLISKLTG